MPDIFDEVAAPARDVFDEAGGDVFDQATAPAGNGVGWAGDKVRRVGQGAAEGVLALPQAVGQMTAGALEALAGVPPPLEFAPMDFRNRVRFRQQFDAGLGEADVQRRERQRMAARPAVVDDVRAAADVFGALRADQREVYGANPALDQTLGAQIAGAVGSTLPALVGTLATGGTAAPAYAMTGLQLYQESFDRAVQSGQPPERAHAAGLASVPLTWFEKFGDVRIGQQLRGSLDAAFQQGARQGWAQLARQQAGRVAGSMVGEGFTEGAQTAGQQLLVDGRIDNAEVGRSALVGAAAGGLLSVPGVAVDVGANRKSGKRKAESGNILPAPADQKVFSEFGGESLRLATMPEAPATLAAQLDRFRTGQRPAVLFTPGDADPLLMDGEVLTPTEQGRVLHNPATLSVEAVTKAARENRMGELLGYGVPAKPSTLNPQPSFVVTQRDAQGTPVNDVVATPATAPQVATALQQQARPGDTLEVRPPEQVIDERAAAFGQALDARDQQDSAWNEFTAPAGPPVENNAEAQRRMARENAEAVAALRAEREKAAGEKRGKGAGEQGDVFDQAARPTFPPAPFPLCPPAPRHGHGRRHRRPPRRRHGAGAGHPRCHPRQSRQRGEVRQPGRLRRGREILPCGRRQAQGPGQPHPGRGRR